MALQFPRRPAFTLIELLVVVSLIIVLATLTVAVANSSLVDSYRIVGGADRLSGWLLQAKQRAVRDRTPVGLRLIPDTSNPNVCFQAQIVEMPTIYAANQNSDINSLPYGAPFVCVRYVNQSVRLPDTSINVALNQESVVDAGVFLYWPNALAGYPTLTVGVDIQQGDLIRLGELNSVHRISTITAITTPTFYTNFGKPALPAGQWYKLVLANSNLTMMAGQQFPSSPPFPTNLLPTGFAYSSSTTNLNVAGTVQSYPTGYPALGGATYYQSPYFGLYRGSRPILGEPLLEMPMYMGIDVFPGQDLPPAGLANNLLAPSLNVPVSPAGAIEVMFNPNGSVMFTNGGQIVFWIRDVRNSNGNEPLALTASPIAPNANVPAISDYFINRDQLMNSGEHVLVSINAKTGAIGTYPVYPPDQNGRYDGRPISISGGDGGLQGPYKYALKASNTGL
ncbi:MAG: hypothetical protein U0798_09000 [Gemmataceae bacterium]